VFYVGFLKEWGVSSYIVWKSIGGVSKYQKFGGYCGCREHSIGFIKTSGDGADVIFDGSRVRNVIQKGLHCSGGVVICRYWFTSPRFGLVNATY